ncbi:type II toxin-antitoxin system mRNA interferase toxin, RelE/StbE family [Candidatus Micrarchaeota archaeon]|nr:type II toxin-antitoxin system mRNA interferase toxin, RelE/StbE family [Candidatus Micrarchaeota archaeon]MBU1939639.1 type II toxin-antitoxin system mRNA interferase toxin, RelE/StbE family [Candidatus Micrarchaeota archaeon]
MPLPYSLERKPHLDRVFTKLAKKDPAQLRAIHNKVKQIIENPHRFKPLGAKMKNMRRVHILKSFVLVYEIHESEKIVELWDYDHHDRIYRK